MTIDPLELEVFRYAVESVVDELEINLTRTAHSEIIYEYKDYCVCVLTPDFRLLSQSKGSMPSFLADVPEPVRDAVSVIGEKWLAAGDVFITNYADANGQHLNNVIAAAPVIADGAVCAYVAIRVHWVDVGGTVLGSTSWEATSIFHEGTQYRGIKVMDRGRVLPEVMATIAANSHLPKRVVGDLMAQVAACSLGARRWKERIVARWSREEVDALVEAQFAASAALARAQITAVPSGSYYAECSLDKSPLAGIGRITLKLRIDIADGRMVVTFVDLPGQVKVPINAGATGGAASAIRVGFKSVFAPERPADHGLFEALEVSIPPGTILSATGEAPMGHWFVTFPTLVDLFIRALADELPHLGAAGHHATFSATTFTSTDAHGYWWYGESHNGGFGASIHGDGFGPLKTLMHGDNKGIPTELMEGRYPLRAMNYELRRDAGGKGHFRGGAGIERTLELLAPAVLETFIDRTEDPPWGVNGGGRGQPGQIQIKLPGSRGWKTMHNRRRALPAGTLVRVRTAGGGGWGPVSADGSTEEFLSGFEPQLMRRDRPDHSRSRSRNF